MSDIKNQGSPATVVAKVRCAGTKIHGPNSPDVLSGKVLLGHRESVDFGENAEQLIEVDYDQAVELWGEETAIELFAGVPREE